MHVSTVFIIAMLVVFVFHPGLAAVMAAGFWLTYGRK